MRSRRFRWWKILGLVLAGLLLVCAGGLLMLEWRPEPLEPTPITAATRPDPAPRAGARLTLISWNLGYAGLDAGADFFMDGGKGVRPSDRARVERNLAAQTDWLAQHPAEVVLLQEVDFDSSRTFGQDQALALSAALPELAWARARNFKVAWVPYPLLTPLGRMDSGLLSLSRFTPTAALRHQLPGSYAWPVRVFHLKRCLHELRFPAPDGHDWIVLHLHLSAFDQGGALRVQEMEYLRRLMQRLYSEGHHVIVGGDFNHAPPDLPDGHFEHRAETPFWFMRVPPDWTPTGWRWAWDSSVPSLRAVNEPYRPGQTFTTTVDAFLLGPDVELVSVETFDLGFAHSDHQPVRLKVALKAGNDPG